tara:strand:+ start:363 stop:611 length:249 start_codon:yes stop_codon:yes gene_type:complete
MLDLDKIDFKKVDVDVDEDGHMWLVEENDWKSAAEEKELYNSVPPADTMTPVKETAMSDIGDEYMDEEWIDMHDEVFSKVKK